jgi:uncharacterized protein
MSLDHPQIINDVHQWVEHLVVGLNLCPFARRELVTNRVHFQVSDATTEEQLLADLQQALSLITDNPAIETLLLIHPAVLQDFYDYNDFLDYADGLLQQMDLEGVFQIASFHPDYQFQDTEPGDVRNYTNKSPYPMLHILNEASLEQAIANHPDIDSIPECNQALLQSMGIEQVLALLAKAKVKE